MQNFYFKVYLTRIIKLTNNILTKYLVLRKNNCLKIIGERPAKITGDKWNELTAMQLLIYTWHSDGVLFSVAEEKTMKGIWDTLIKLYQIKSLHNNIFLKRRLYTFRIAETITMTDHINTFKTLFSQLTTLGVK